jgi:hypothetical protein
MTKRAKIVIANLLLAIIVVVAPLRVVAMNNEPTGYEKANFGLSVEEVKKLYPGIEELPLSKSLGAPVIKGPFITRYLLAKQKVPGAEAPVDLELRFWKGKLWLFIAYFGQTQGEAVVAKLKETYGPPTSDHAGYPIWNGAKTAIVVEMKDGRYTVQYNEFSTEAQAWYIAELKKELGGKGVKVAETSPKPAGTAPPAVPEATPAAGPEATPAAGKE